MGLLLGRDFVKKITFLLKFHRQDGIRWMFISLFIYLQEVYEMDNWTFGMTMLIVGMGGTLLTLWILSLIMGLLKKAFPYKKEAEGK